MAEQGTFGGTFGGQKSWTDPKVGHFWRHLRRPKVPDRDESLFSGATSAAECYLHKGDVGDKYTFWNMEFNIDLPVEDKREKYGKRYEKTFEQVTAEDIADRREKYGKRYEQAFAEKTADRTEKYGKRYEDTADRTEKYGKRYEDAADRIEKYGKRYEDAADRIEKYGKRYEDAANRTKKYGKRYEDAADRTEKYGKWYEDAANRTEKYRKRYEDIADRTEKYGKRYEDAADRTEKYGKRYEDTADRTEKYGKRYEDAADRTEKTEKYGKRYEDTADRTQRYGQRYEQAFAEDTIDRREKYGKRYEQPFVEDTTDRREKYGKRYEREKYGKRYEQSFVEDTTDKREQYGIPYEQAFAEDSTDRREKYGKRYELKFNKHALPNSTVFFLPNDLHAGKNMRLHIIKSANKARILPRQVANSLPFSTNKLAEIMKHFSQTVEDCESPGIKGEDRFCPTSLESLVDFSVKHVGNKAQVFMNEIDKPKREQEYTIKEVKFIGGNHVVCHKQKYPYAVYYCHALNGTKVYTAQVVGADGTKAKAVAVCHTNTSAWNPGHLAFLVLNMKPGEGTVCHFIRSDTFVMVSN
ncbi:hypothetical protein MANES_06G160750v8 [Manihot esculenta]|uniref:Uncharacterized protein n=1 Tax=Manihot esculenta TaxID=3983 RepID=A0ACB7HM23_MANES|nr:hypothetical protein MANES_06G160750v8 [Manihot esculenta]